MILNWTITGKDSSGTYTRESGSTLTKKTYTTAKSEDKTTKSTSTTTTVKSSSTSGGSANSSGEQRTITSDIDPITIVVNGETKTWKGDTNDAAGIAAWKASYTPGYTPTIISPRDESGNYTADPAKTVSYTILSEEEHALELAKELKNETNVPMGIIQTLQQKLQDTTSKITITEAPTAITKTITQEEEVQNRVIKDLDVNDEPVNVIQNAINRSTQKVNSLISNIKEDYNVSDTSKKILYIIGIILTILIAHTTVKRGYIVKK